MADYLKLARAALQRMSSTPNPPNVTADGTGLGELVEIEAIADPTELARATGVLNRAGVRNMNLESGQTIGVWRSLDGPEIRAALRALKLDKLPLRFLDEEGIPNRYSRREYKQPGD